MTDNLPFTIDWVVDIDLPGVKKYKAARGTNIDCPFCKEDGDKKGKEKLNYNDSNGKWRCARCNNAGNSVILHSKLTGLGYNEALADLMKRWNGLPSDVKIKLSSREKGGPEYVPPHTFLLNTAYTSLLDQLTLSDKHRKDLRVRGLSDEDIKAFGYKTYPKVGMSTFARNAIVKTGVAQAMLRYEENEHFSSDQHCQIPGFFDFGNDVRMVRRQSSFFVPVRNIDGTIDRFQLRHDIKPTASYEDKKKYTSWSSGEKETGCSVTGTSNIHWVGFPESEDYRSDEYRTPEQVELTEGALKGDIAHTLSDRHWAFICLLGVSNYGQLSQALEYLKKHGTKRINICFDMDYLVNSNVQSSLDKVKRMITDAGLSWEWIKWDPKYNGVDDWLLARKKFIEAKKSGE